jgi:hypothetical protein
VAFVAVVVEPHTSLSVALMEEEAAAELIIANCRSVMSQQLQHSMASWSIG